MNDISSVQGHETRWPKLRRLEFIETCLFWEGRLNRADLCERFGISVPQATVDIRDYMARAPGNCVYDATVKAYVATAQYEPTLIQPSADRYLQQLAAIKSGNTRERDLYVATVPPYDVVPAPARPVRTELFRTLLRAIRERQSIEIVYQSLSHNQPQARRISPHAFGSDGLRWHVRAYCHKDEEFKDFVLGRILSVSTPKKSTVDPNDDWEWNTFQDITIMPNPGLSVDQQQHIAADYGMSVGISTIRVRSALLFYFEKLLNRGGPKEQPAARPIVSPNLATVIEEVKKRKAEESGGGPTVHPEFKLPLEAIYAQALTTMESVFKELELKVPRPEMIELPNGVVKYRYKSKTVEQAIVLKLSRIISGLHAVLTLNVQGLYQEQALVQRVVDEINEDIYFLCGAIFQEKQTDLHKRYLDWFYAEEFGDDLQPLVTHKRRPMTQRNEIRAYIAEAYGTDDAERDAHLSRTLYRTYSGYVHAAMPHIMDTYGGSPPHFHVSGMLGTPRTFEYKVDAWNYFYRGLQSFRLAVLAFKDEALGDAVFKYLLHFERAMDKKYHWGERAASQQ